MKKIKYLLIILTIIFVSSLVGCKKEYTVTFMDYDGTVIKEVVVTKNGSASAPSVPTRDGYDFIGWSETFNDVTRDIDVVAQYKEKGINQALTVRFANELNQDLYIINVESGQRIPVPEIPTKKGHKFLGWYYGDTKWDFLNMTVAYNMTLIQKWEAQYVDIIFDTDGGTTVETITKIPGESVTAPSNPTKEGYTFVGWNQEIPTTMPDEDLTIKAIWSINQYTITFNTNGGTEINSITLNYGETITKPSNPTKAYSDFIGWDISIPSTMPAYNLTINAKWQTEKYTVSFDTNGGEFKNPIQYEYGASLLTIADPIYNGHGFLGWENAPSTMPAENITLKAIWCDISENYIFDGNKLVAYIGHESNVIIPRSYSVSQKQFYVTEISKDAFTFLYDVTSITISDKILTIDSNAFVSLYNLTGYIVNPNNRAYQSIDGNIYSKDGRTFVKYATGKTEETFKIPDTVITIEESSFQYARKLKNIEFSKNMNSISKYAFSHSGLTTIEIPNNIGAINDYAFYNTDIEKITIPNTVKKLGECSFSQSYYLTEVIFEENSKITILPQYLFENCEKLSFIEIPASITTIEIGVFASCSSLTAIDVNEKNLNFKSIDGDLYTIDEKTLSLYAPGKQNTSFTLPTSVEFIGDNAFYRSVLIEFIVPDNSSLIEIGDCAFFNCAFLERVNFGQNCILETLGKQAFSYCDVLTSFDIPQSVNQIDSTIFFGSGDLQQINVDSNNSNYKSVDGILYSKNMGDLIIFPAGKEMTTFNVPYGVVVIESYAFSYCEYLENIVLSNTVMNICEQAFYFCSTLKNVYIPNSVTSIENFGFYYCKSLTIYCERASQPSGWGSAWNYSNTPVVWGYTEE